MGEFLSLSPALSPFQINRSGTMTMASNLASGCQMQVCHSVLVVLWYSSFGGVPILPCSSLNQRTGEGFNPLTCCLTCRGAKQLTCLICLAQE